MANGIEKRRFKRMKADLSLNVSSLFKQDNMEIKNLDSPIKVINISEGGIAFMDASLSVWHRFLVISLMNMRLRLKLEKNKRD